MKILVIGATGVIGTRIVSQLQQNGHEVTGTSRSPGKAARLRALGAEPVVLDALDAKAVREAVGAARPEAIIYQATALAGVSDFKHFDRSFGPTNQLRAEGTEILVGAAREAGVRRIVAQSYASHRYAREGGWVKTEDDPLDPDPPAAMRDTITAMAHLDQAVTGAGGIALRYGNFYGDPSDGWAAIIRARKFPVVGDGSGVWSFIHLDDAATATVLALEH
ncbi:MAG: NAD-dependent epimerase/dehydratase family protein, partial [Solirubrobacteraceae bacterium]